MKQETKQRLKHYLEIGQYIVIALCWLMALVGVTSYSVYWLRQNANYQTEPATRTLTQKREAINDKSLSYYRLKSLSYLQQDLSYRGNENNYRDYFALDQGAVGSVFYEYTGDIKIKLYDNTSIEYEVMRFNFSKVDNESFQLSYIYFKRSTGVWEYYYYYNNDNVYDNSVIFFSGLRVQSRSSTIAEYVDFGVLKFYMDLVFSTDSDYATSFQFKKDYNFDALCSDNITGDSNVIQPYKMNYRDDPSDTLIYFYIPFEFVSNNYIYKGIWLEFEKPIYVRINGEDKQVNFPSSTSQLMVKNVYYMRSLPSTNTPDILPSASTMDLVASRYRYGQKQWNNGVSDVYAFVYGTDYEFINDAYRLIYIHNNSYNGYYSYYARPLPSNTDVANSGGLWNPYLYRGLTLLQVLNNGYLTYELGTLTYSNNDIGLDNVFSLISSAFTGLLPILAVQVIPGISIGLLLFVPVIVTLIIVIFRLVKK